MDIPQLKRINEWNNRLREAFVKERKATYDEHFPLNRKVLDDPESAHKESE